VNLFKAHYTLFSETVTEQPLKKTFMKNRAKILPRAAYGRVQPMVACRRVGVFLRGCHSILRASRLLPNGEETESYESDDQKLEEKIVSFIII
jgi:hypothetical protein